MKHQPTYLMVFLSFFIGMSIGFLLSVIVHLFIYRMDLPFIQESIVSSVETYQGNPDEDFLFKRLAPPDTVVDSCKGQTKESFNLLEKSNPLSEASHIGFLESEEAYLMLGTFTEKHQAEKWRKKLAALGVSPTIRTLFYPSGQKEMYQIYIGPFDNKHKAFHMRQELLEHLKENVDILIVASPESGLAVKE